ncbi:MAG TPA: hypothetical protein VK928_07235 [Longimicrobiales bacterium]|nr:hypothetical protein [Longimicrobiales bacterium]
MCRRFLSAGPRPVRTPSYRAALRLGGLALLLAVASAVPAQAQQAPAAADAAVAAPATAPVTDGMAGPRRVEPLLQAGTVAPPALEGAVAPVVAGDTLWTLEARRGSRGQFFLFLVGLVAVGAGTYKLGETLEVEALESVGAFVAGAGLLGIIIPIWLFM